MVNVTVDDLFARYGLTYRALITVTGMTASFAMVISSTIVNVAVPDVMGSFGIGQDQAQLMATAFNVAMTASQLLNAWVVAVLGQRYGFAVTLILFTLGSLIAGFGQEFGMIVFGRVLQGAAAGVIQPLVMVTIFQVFPADRRGLAMGIYAMGLMLALAFGPVLGGVAIEAFDWRYIFFATLPLVGIALMAGLVFMPSVRSETRQPFDWTGYVLVVIALFCLMTGLTDGQREGWTSNYTLGLFLTAVVAGAAFIGSQMRPGAKLLDLTLFRDRQFATAMLVVFTVGIGNFVIIYAVPVFGQLVQGMTPLRAGMVMLPAGVLVVFVLPFTGRLSDHLRPHLAIMAGLMFFAAGAAPMADADVNTPFLMIAIYAIIARSGSSLIMPFVMTTALKTVPPEKLNAGAGAVNFCRQLGGSLGLNAWVVFIEIRTRFHSESLTATQSSDNQASRELLQGVGRILGESGVPQVLHEPGALHYLGQMVHAQATTLGFQDGFWILVIVYLLGLIPAWILGRTNRGQ